MKKTEASDERIVSKDKSLDMLRAIYLDGMLTGLVSGSKIGIKLSDEDAVRAAVQTCTDVSVDPDGLALIDGEIAARVREASDAGASGRE